MSKNKIYFHSAHHGIGEMLINLDAAGIPFCIKAIDNAGFAVQGAQLARASGLPHSIILRFTGPGDLPHDIPNYTLSPQEAANVYWVELSKSIRGAPELEPYRDLIWIETINEARTQYDSDNPNWGNMHPVDWLGEFGFYLAQHVLNDGYKACLYGMNAGTPEPEDWSLPGMRRFLELAAANPDRVAISLHEGKIPGYDNNQELTIDSPPVEYSPFIVGRFQWLMDACNTMQIGWPTIFISEWAWSSHDLAGKSIVERDIDWLARYVAQWGNVRGVFLWNLHPEGWAGLGDKLKQHIPFVTHYALTTELPEPSQHPPDNPTLPPVGLPVARVKYTRITVLIHPTDGKPFADAVTAATWKAGDPNLPHYFTVGASADDAGVAVLYELPDHSLAPIPRYVIAVNPERWGPGDDGRGLAGFFETYYAGVNYVPVAAATPEALRLLLDNFDPANPPAPTPPLITLPVDALNQRDSRWASVVMGTNSKGEIETIGSWGCLVTAYAMQAKQFGVVSYNPAEMWAYMKAKGATSGPNLNPAALRTAFPDKVKYLGYQTGGANLPDRIRAHIDAGYTVPGRVDHNPATGQVEQHWILVDGYERDSGRIHMTDPWTGKKQFVDEVYDINGNDVLEALFYEPLTELPPPEPPTTPAYKYNGPAVTFSPALHQPASDWEWARPQSQEQFTKTNLPVKWLSDGVNANYWGLFNKPAYHLVRIMWKPDRKKTPAEAWNDVKDGVVRFYQKGARRFELHNELNLPEEGWGTVWTTPQEAGTWLREWALIIRQACPLAKLYFPGLSPGVPWTNQFTVSVGAWAICKDLMSGFAMHAYTGIVDNEAAAANELVHQVKELQRFMNLHVPLSVSELSVNRQASAAYKVAVYKRVENALRVIPGVEAVCYYISSWEQVPTSQAPHQESWAKHGIGDAYAALAG